MLLAVLVWMTYPQSASSDLVEGVIRMMDCDGFTGPVNLGNPGEFTVKELVIEETGSKSEIVHKPLPAADPVRRHPSIGLAMDNLGWEPTVPLREGLKPVIEYFARMM